MTESHELRDSVEQITAGQSSRMIQCFDDPMIPQETHGAKAAHGSTARPSGQNSAVSTGSSEP